MKKRKKKGGEVPDCTKCGACCISLQDQQCFCDLTEKDLDKMSPQFIRANVLFSSPFDLLCSPLVFGKPQPLGALKTKYLENKRGYFKGCTACACAMLEGSLMYEVKCRIYESRPEVCRKAVVAGDKSCKAIRRHLLNVLDDDKPIHLAK
jgi:Fe-S-cluster containining protein